MYVIGMARGSLRYAMEDVCVEPRDVFESSSARVEQMDRWLSHRDRLKKKISD